MNLANEKKLDLSLIMPCLNEENTIGDSIDEARCFISAHDLNAEIIIVDNDSTDRSADEAAKHGAAVVTEHRRGYGRAIRTGIENSSGGVLIIADCDTTYDLVHLEQFCFPLLRGECDVMIGDRFAGGIEKGAMPFLHRVGVPFLSWCGRMGLHTDVRDFHCGLRSLTREAAQTIVPHTDGMEFSTELIAEAARSGLRISQTPTVLRRARNKRSSKLHTFSDGFRHLRYILNTSRKEKQHG